ncbi:hypothetical protein [Novosphingobium sediminicola]|uniref:Uncharacterized protein n=1 Tax=Novosphingobium sediminicola TaxID=563162 RepID=A0A7W6CFD6_9SPHN|nr:hypothetical protein [Novosphingobium sediminicola]MBB3955501.1 hypothetical protein [Novosphingobium sediminicola]
MAKAASPPLRLPGRHHVVKPGAAKVAGRLAGWVVVLAVAGEILARLALTSPSIQIADPDLRYTNQPGAVLFQANEGFERIQLNSLGLNDGEIAPNHAGPRMLFIGDSMLLAHQVPRQSNYTSLLEGSLGIDAVNGGRDALGPAEWGVMVRRLAPAVRPDYIVVMMTRGDAFDLRDALIKRAEAAQKATGAPTHPGRLAGAFDALLHHSALATFLARRANLYVTGVRKGGGWLPYILHGFRASPAPKPDTQDFPVAAITAQLAERMAEAQKRDRVIFISIPAFTYHADGRMEFEPRSAVEQAIFPAAAKQAGMPFVDLGDGMRAEFAHSGQPFVGFQNSVIGTGHLNTYGHEVIARLIAAHMPDLMKQADAAHARSAEAPANTPATPAQ